MNNRQHRNRAEKVKGNVHESREKPNETGFTIETYAEAAQLPLDFLEKLGLRTVDNPWIEGRLAVAIPYRRRNGAAFRDRIWQSFPAGLSKRRKPVWDKRQEKLGALLYGLDQLPAAGCPVVLVDDESACHTLWHHGIDAVGVAGACGFYAKRDDPELNGLSIIVLPPDGETRSELLERLSVSQHRKSIRVAKLSGYSNILELHREAPGRFEDILNAAIEAAEPLDAVLRREPEIDANKGSAVAGNLEGTVADNLVTLAQRSATFFSAPDESTWGAVTVAGRRETWGLRSQGFRKWLIHQFFKATKKAPTPDALNQALLTLDAVARYDGDEHPVFVRTAQRDGKYYLDLADEQWRAVEIDEAGWRLSAEPPVHFRRPPGMLALPEPVPGGSLQELRDLLNLSGDDDFILIVAWLVAALRPKGPYPLMAIAGEPGSSKSSTARVLRSLVDPNFAALRAAPREERDCWIQANNAGMLAFDNLSSIPAWLSDALCRVATGGGFATRQLHTDDNEMLFDAMRPTLLTSVADVIARSDLADRAIMIELPTISDTQRIDEETFNAAFEAAKPRILGALLDVMVVGLRNRNSVKLAKLPRLADFAVWATACEPAFTQPGGVMKAYRQNAADAVHSVIEGDPVCVALLAFLAAHNNKWRGSGGELLSNINNFAQEGAKRDRDWPRNAQSLSGRLRLATPSLRKIGVTVERGKSHGERYIEVSKE